MFQKLKQKWKVNGTQLFLIVCVFAITGTTTAWLTRQITTWLHLTASSPWYWILKIMMLVFGYQALILLFAIPFGQFNFFWNYEKKIWRRMGIGNRESAIGNRQLNPKGDSSLHLANNQAFDDSETNNPLHNIKSDQMAEQPSFDYAQDYKPQTMNIAIFASGAGSNAKKLIEHFRHHNYIKVALIVCNKPEAGVLNIARDENIPALLIEKEKFFRGNAYVDELRSFNVQFIVLAGFLWKVPVALIQAFPQRIINIHPALLPNYGGKGMYGRFVHEAIINAGEKESGISIHYVDELYDHGQLIFQARCTIESGETADSLAQKIHTLEHEHYPLIAEKVIIELQNRR